MRNTWTNWLRRIFGRGTPLRPSRKAQRVRSVHLQLEALEDRLTPAAPSVLSIDPPVNLAPLPPAAVVPSSIRFLPQPVISLAAAHDFFIDSRGLFENSLGGNEKWLQGSTNAFGNPWYFILPSGDIYEWNGSAGLTGNLLLNSDTSVWRDADVLAGGVTAANTAELWAADQARAFYRSSAGNFYLNSLGGNEKWIEGMISAKSPANQNNPWYYILPDGSVYEWDGSGTLSGTRVSGITADPNLWHRPEMLCNAYRGRQIDSGVPAQLHLHFDNTGLARNLYENWGHADEKWLAGDQNQFGNRWYFILPNGTLYAWDGKTSATGQGLAQLGEGAWNNIEDVVNHIYAGSPVID
jgi:hypothetical protein